MGIGISIGLPFGGRLIHPKWAVALYTLDFPMNTTRSIIMVENRPIDEARNMIVKSALEQESKYILFIDDDVLLPRYAVQALGSLLDYGKDDGVMVATGIYCTKSFVPTPLIFRNEVLGPFLDWSVNDTFEVDDCGAGCMLINTEVFKHIEFPYFAFKEEYKTVPNSPDPILTGISEDRYFCRKVKEAGFKIKAHGAVICPHYDEKQNKFYTLPENSPPYQKELKRQQAEIKEKQQEV